MPKKFLLTSAAVVILLIIIPIGLYVTRTKTPKYSSIQTPSSVLNKTNLPYTQARQLLAQGDYTAAQESYQKALQQATDDIQKGQIRFNIAYAEELKGNFIEAIRLFKTLAADTTAGALMRAYAVQEIGLIHYNYFNTDRAAIVAETFKDTPYSAFKEGADDDLAYRKLFEYATSLYPVGSSETYIAYWYANDILNTLKSTTTLQAQTELLIINEKLRIADAEILKTTNDPIAQVYISGMYSRYGLIHQMLARASASSLANAETYFQKGVRMADTINRFGWERYRYARFLSDTYGNKRIEDIQTLVSVFSTKNNLGVSSQTRNFFQVVGRDSTLTEDKRSIIKMAKIAPDFKTYLISLGWNENNF